MGHLKTISFQLETNGKLMVLGVPILKHFRVITKSDQSGPNHQLLQLCTACTAWSDSDQAVLAVHSCTTWLIDLDSVLQKTRTVHVQDSLPGSALPVT